MSSFSDLSQNFHNLSVNEDKNFDLASSAKTIPLRKRIFQQ